MKARQKFGLLEAMTFERKFAIRRGRQNEEKTTLLLAKTYHQIKNEKVQEGENPEHDEITAGAAEVWIQFFATVFSL
jgi:hypothetical protein